jgi:hypothetical protein
VNPLQNKLFIVSHKNHDEDNHNHNNVINLLQGAVIFKILSRPKQHRVNPEQSPDADERAEDAAIDC